MNLKTLFIHPQVSGDEALLQLMRHPLDNVMLHLGVRHLTSFIILRHTYKVKQINEVSGSLLAEFTKFIGEAHIQVSTLYLSQVL